MSSAEQAGAGAARPRVTILDYGMGNLRSVAHAFEAVGAQALVTARPDDLLDAERIVLPGVGAFGEAMSRLKESGAVPRLREQVLERKTPFLGICLGMQLMAERGEELGRHDGLGWLPGTVRRIEPADPSIRVPHVGWNSVQFQRDSVLFRGLEEAASFYFVHSFHLADTEPGVVTGTCSYGAELVVAVERGHVFGTQFHPEKSHQSGLALLRNFLSYPGAGC